MHLSEIITGELQALRERTGREVLRTLETGTIRNVADEYRQNDGWSTLTFAKEAARTGGRHTGIDLSLTAVTSVLLARDLMERVTLIEGYSISELAEMIRGDQPDQFDVILLDSDNDSDLILHEFMIARHLLAPDGVLFVDDVYPGSRHVLKGNKIVPYLDSIGVQYDLMERTGRPGFTSGFMIVRP